MSTLLLLAVLAQAPEPAPNDLKFSWAADLGVTAGLGLTWLLTETAFKSDLAPTQCAWCGHNALDDSIRRAFVPPGTVTFDGVKAPDTASAITAFVLTPVLVFGLDALMARSVKGWVQDAVIVIEAAAAAAVADQFVKFAVGRQRPFVSDLTAAQQTTTRDPSDNNLSFYSSHATFTAAFAVAGGVVALQRGYRYPWAIWLLAGLSSVATCVLRLSADKHYFSDVLTGTLVGAGFGVALPLLFHGLKNLPVEASVTPGGVALHGKF